MLMFSLAFYRQDFDCINVTCDDIGRTRELRYVTCRLTSYILPAASRESFKMLPPGNAVSYMLLGTGTYMTGLSSYVPIATARQMAFYLSPIWPDCTSYL